MELVEFAKLVREMRDKQKAYFARRDNFLLTESKRLEKQVDEAVKDICDQPRLFE